MDIDEKLILSIKGLSHIYDKWGMEIHALKDVSIDFSPGQLTMLVGPNGAGKSTLLHLLSGEVSGRTSGRIHYNGKDLLNQKRTEKTKYVAMIQQDPKLSAVSDLTVIEHFGLLLSEYGSWLKPVNSSLRSTVTEMLKPFNLEEHLDIPAGLLSGGERQILALLMTRLRKVGILLLDEPIAALDTGNAKACLKQIKQAVSEGVTVLMITHDLNIACKYGNRLLGLVGGQLIFDYYYDKDEEHYEPYKIWKTLEDKTNSDL